MAVSRTLYLSGTQLSIQLPAGFIQGIIVNNPTPSWLRIDPIRELVPPYTWGWQRDLPNNANVSVIFLGNSPSGSVSATNIVTNSKVEVTVVGANVGDSDGSTSGAGLAQAVQPRLTSVFAPYTASQTGVAVASTLLTISAATRRFVVRRLRLIPDYTNGSPGGPLGFNHPIEVEFIDSLVGPFWVLAISPEEPHDEVVFEDGAMILTTGANVQVAGIVEQGGGSQFYNAGIQLYEQSTVPQ